MLLSYLYVTVIFKYKVTLNNLNDLGLQLNIKQKK